MTVEEIPNEGYPYRLPVFVLDNSDGYSQAVLNNILVDNARNNITYNNNALMFLRKKQFVPGTSTNNEIFSDLDKITPIPQVE